MSAEIKGYPGYSDEFKLEAVRLARSRIHGGIATTAEHLGIGKSTLGKWVSKSAELEDGMLTAEDQMEMARLRREVALLREEREILKKAAAFFARETDRTR